MALAIKVENVGKKYRLGTINRDMLYKDIQSWWAKMRGKPDPNAKISFIHQNRLEKGDEFWALRNINLEIEEGEIVGIIGRNGAGKSTLLKILSQITAPTEGKIHVNGRMASLLEVGTGFHPELTGRENVYLNGAILGMSRKEVSKKFDEIVDFSEVEEFIDTPVKRYSSGMYVRLAFSVAAHLEPEILIVDEVLAVGDAAFQKKCIGKMDEANSNGRTILIVSHNMALLSSLCKSAVVLSDGKVCCEKTDIQDAIQVYLNETEKVTELSIEDRKDRKGEGKIKITNFSILGPEKTIQKKYLSGQEIYFKIDFQTFKNKKVSRLDFNITIKSPQKGLVSLLSSDLTGQTIETFEGNGTFSCIVKKLPLAPGSYILNLSVKSGGVIQDWIKEIAILNVIEGDFYSTGRSSDKSHSGFFIEHSWLEIS
jgi:lipopolysaccharide transport system ATP-binding protein